MTPPHTGGDPDLCPGCRALPARDVPAILCPGPGPDEDDRSPQ